MRSLAATLSVRGYGGNSDARAVHLVNGVAYVLACKATTPRLAKPASGVQAIPPPQRAHILKSLLIHPSNYLGARNSSPSTSCAELSQRKRFSTTLCNLEGCGKQTPSDSARRSPEMICENHTNFSLLKKHMWLISKSTR